MASTDSLQVFVARGSGLAAPVAKTLAWGEQRAGPAPGNMRDTDAASFGVVVARIDEQRGVALAALFASIEPNIHLNPVGVRLVAKLGHTYPAPELLEVAANKKKYKELGNALEHLTTELATCHL